MYISYNNVHQLCQESADKIKQFKPDLIIAIGGGGFIPARMLRSFLKEPGQPNVRIMAIILSLYEEIENSDGVQENPVLKLAELNGSITLNLRSTWLERIS